MNKTISINLSGLIFYVEEEGYEKLRAYLDNIRAQFKNSDEAEMVIEDVELRIAEIFTERANGGPVTSQDVDHVITVMGEATAYAPDEEEDETSGQQSSTKTNTVYVKSGLYRDPENGYIGGVCEGLGHYFNLDAHLVRALLVIFVLLGGSGILIYIILWAVLPAAKSTNDRLKMKGVAVTVENISKEVNKAGETITRKSKEFSHKVRNETSDGFKSLAKALVKIIGVFFIIAALFSLIAFTTLTIGGLGIVGSNEEGEILSLFELSKLFFENGFMNTLAWTCVYIAKFSLIILLALVGVKLIWNTKAKSIKYLSVSLFVLFIITFISSFAIGINTALQFEASAEDKVEVGAIITDTLEVHYFSDRPVNSSAIYRTERDEVLRLEDENILLRFEDMDYRTSEDSMTRIYHSLKANGATSVQAYENLEHIKHNVYMEGNKLYVDLDYKFPAEDKIRNQEAEIDIYKPKNVVVETYINGEHHSTRSYNGEDDDYNYRRHYERGIHVHSDDHNGKHEVNITF
ncbi:PspC domain-containing protein [Lishizhenia sp.]|uniref:PspC domain-containing protein n=1 Tax=Lishizhenia sp. TaxID=2497594 RepID=UPI00299F2DE4|nr:PspC domain-containing protein [Lishizhenia sp.]MDX1446035.1 PspC domain-containing protein [Lishizhenia sp.]